MDVKAQFERKEFTKITNTIGVHAFSAIPKHSSALMCINVLTCSFLLGVGTEGTQGRGTLALQSGWHTERQSVREGALQGRASHKVWGSW